jgi:hypothetical protein
MAAEAAVALPEVSHRRGSERDTGKPTLSCREKVILKDLGPLSVTLLDGQLFEGKEIS